MLYFFLILPKVWGSLVIDLPQNDPTPVLNYDFKITNVISFCIRFKFEGIQGYRSVFCSDPFCMKFEISQQYGFVFLNGETLIFKIPNNSITPYAWHNFCFSFDGQQYFVVVEGNIWHQTNRQSCSRFWEGCHSWLVKKLYEIFVWFFLIFMFSCYLLLCILQSTFIYFDRTFVTPFRLCLKNLNLIVIWFIQQHENISCIFSSKELNNDWF